MDEPLLLMPDVLIPFFMGKLGLLENEFDFIRDRFERSSQLLLQLRETREYRVFVLEVTLRKVADYLSSKTQEKVVPNDLVSLIKNDAIIIKDRKINVSISESNADDIEIRFANRNLYTLLSFFPFLLPSTSTSERSGSREVEELISFLSSEHIDLTDETVEGDQTSERWLSGTGSFDENTELGEDNEDPGAELPPSYGSLPKAPAPIIPNGTSGAFELPKSDIKAEDEHSNSSIVDDGNHDKAFSQNVFKVYPDYLLDSLKEKLKSEHSKKVGLSNFGSSKRILKDTEGERDSEAIKANVAALLSLNIVYGLTTFASQSFDFSLLKRPESAGIKNLMIQVLLEDIVLNLGNAQSRFLIETFSAIVFDGEASPDSSHDRDILPTSGVPITLTLSGSGDAGGVVFQEEEASDGVLQSLSDSGAYSRRANQTENTLASGTPEASSKPKISGIRIFSGTEPSLEISPGPASESDTPEPTPESTPEPTQETAPEPKQDTTEKTAPEPDNNTADKADP
ncbi:MAG: hypothetical protein ACFBSF_05185, partial [Leptolyngbyaceae cyanobacterium]